MALDPVFAIKSTADDQSFKVLPVAADLNVITGEPIQYVISDVIGSRHLRLRLGGVKPLSRGEGLGRGKTWIGQRTNYEVYIRTRVMTVQYQPPLQRSQALTPTPMPDLSRIVQKTRI